MDSNEFSEAPSSMAGNSLEVLAFQWNREALQAIDLIASEHSIPDARTRNAPGFSEEIHEMNIMEDN